MTELPHSIPVDASVPVSGESRVLLRSPRRPQSIGLLCRHLRCNPNHPPAYAIAAIGRGFLVRLGLGRPCRTSALRPHCFPIGSTAAAFPEALILRPLPWLPVDQRGPSATYCRSEYALDSALLEYPLFPLKSVAPRGRCLNYPSKRTPRSWRYLEEISIPVYHSPSPLPSPVSL